MNVCMAMWEQRSVFFMASVGEMLIEIHNYFDAYCGTAAHLAAGAFIEMWENAFVHATDTVYAGMLERTIRFFLPTRKSAISFPGLPE
jgi:hypothetical protein